MNSRTMLLTAILFVVPFSMIIADETTGDAQTEQSSAPAASVVAANPAVEASTLAKAGALFVLPFVKIGNGAGWIANKTYINAAIAKVTGSTYLKDTCVNKPEMIGKTIVLLAAGFAIYKAYVAYNAQNADANDDDSIFYEESN